MIEDDIKHIRALSGANKENIEQLNNDIRAILEYLDITIEHTCGKIAKKRG